MQSFPKNPEQLILPDFELSIEKKPQQMVLPGAEKYFHKKVPNDLELNQLSPNELQQIIYEQFNQKQFLFEVFLKTEKERLDLKNFNEDLKTLIDYLTSAKNILELLLKPDAIIALDNAFSKIGLRLMEYLQANAFTCRKVLTSGDLVLVYQYKTTKSHPPEISKNQIIPQSNLDKVLEQHQVNPIENMCSLEKENDFLGLTPVYQIDPEIQGGSVIIPICDARGKLERIFTFYFANKTKDELDQIKENCSSFYPSFLEIITKTRVLQELVCIDALTQVYNRKMFMTFLAKELKSFQRHMREIQLSEDKENLLESDLKKHTFSLLLLDIDYFKKINDTYGHIIGDYVLSALGLFLKQNLRESDVIGRYGGEEFTIMLPGTDTKGAFDIGEKLLEKIRDELPQIVCQKIQIAIDKLENNSSHHLKVSEKQVLVKALQGCSKANMTVSIGVTTSQINDETELMISRADDALYKAKITGRNRIM